MSRVELETDVYVRTLVSAIEGLGGEVTWLADVPAKTDKVAVVGTADAGDVFAALPVEYHEDEPEWQEPDPDDVDAFIRACARGERGIAVALLPRLNLSDRGTAVGELALRAIGGRS